MKRKQCNHMWVVTHSEMGVNLSKCTKCGLTGLVMNNQSERLLRLLGEPKVSPKWKRPSRDSEVNK